MADEDNYVDNFVAGDDGTLMAAIEQRKSQVQPLVRCVARTCSRFCLRDLFLPQRSLTRFALAGRRVAIRSRRCASRCPIHRTRRKLSPSRCAELLDRARAPSTQTSVPMNVCARACCAIQDASWGVVALAIGAIKDADIEAAVGQLTVNECDILMKYLYRGCALGLPCPAAPSRPPARPPARHTLTHTPAHPRGAGWGRGTRSRRCTPTCSSGIRQCSSGRGRPPLYEQSRR